MNELFLKVINMSISAGCLVPAVVILRFVLKKAPKWVNVLLWGMVAVRLVCPFFIESALSLMPNAENFSEKVISGPGFDIRTGISPVDNGISDYSEEQEDAAVPADNGSAVMTILTVIWIMGILLLVLYTVISYLRLCRRIDTAVLYRDNIFMSENVNSPFVLGIIRPKIYLPFSMDEQSLEHVVAHEQAHICRKDHWWKPLGFLLLAIHWFNPLIWLAYGLLCRDIELACDERVIRGFNNEQRADYTQALLNCSVSRRMIAACPLAFGEVSVKERVRSVMNYRKPGFWMIALAVLVCACAGVCFLTNPVKQSEIDWAQALSADDIESADLVVFPQTQDKQFKHLSEDELAGMVALINQSKGKYQAEYEELTGGSIFFYITMKDGTVHSVGNIGNTYLMIDGTCYKAEYEWLSAWEDEFGEGNASLPDQYLSSFVVVK